MGTTVLVEILYYMLPMWILSVVVPNRTLVPGQRTLGQLMYD